MYIFYLVIINWLKSYAFIYHSFISYYYYLCLLKGIRSGLERVFPPKGGCNPVVGLQCAARIGGKDLKEGT
jgi:hypothetical protein